MTIFCVKLAVFSKPLPTFEELGVESTKIQFCMSHCSKTNTRIDSLVKNSMKTAVLTPP